MPLRRNDQLWANLPGIVAAYQPVRAPGPLLARYNMAHGGDNYYRAGSGALPAWHGATGWTFDGIAQYLNTGINPANTWTMLARFSGTANKNFLCGRRIAALNNEFGLLPCTSSNERSARNDGQQAASYTVGTGWLAEGVFGLDYTGSWLNGRRDISFSVSPKPLTGVLPIYIGATNQAGSPFTYFAGCVQAFVIYSRALGPAEAWSVSRQMAYCDVNPDWSVWGPRRQWFYGPQVGGFQAAWAQRHNRLLGGGMN